MIKRWFGSLVNRAVALVILVILLSALVVTIVGAMLSQGELEQQAKNQVETMARLVASGLDDKLALRLETLSHVAESFTMDESVLNARARVLIRQQTALQHLFDGLYLIDASGVVLAEYPEAFEQTGLNVSTREYFQDVSHHMTPVISDPYVSNYRDKPAVMIAAPIFDHRKKFLGMIGGAILLKGSNFMAEFAGIRIGKTGYLEIGTRSGITLAHGRTDEVMVPVRVEDPVLKDAMGGFEGTRQTRNGQGEGAIMSVQQMAQVPWFVAVVWPAREAFAPITRMADAFGWTLLAVIAVIGPLALWVFQRLMAPLRALGRQINERHLGVRTNPVEVSGGREIRQVAEIFNTVMDEREEVLGSLAEREAFFRSLTQSAPIGIVQTDVLGRIDFVNPAFESLIGRPASELQHTQLINGVYEADREAVRNGWQQALRDKEIFRGRFRIPSRGERELIWGDVMTAVIETPEKALGSITVVRDISRELEVEEALREEQQRAEHILGVLQEGVLMVDVQGRIRYANQAACVFLGTDGKCLKRNFFDLVVIEANDGPLAHADFLTGDNVDSLYGTLRNQKDEVFDIDLTMLHVRQGKHNERMVFVIRDDSERRREEERLSWEATHDSLTQLLNRRAFSASLVKCMAEVPHQTVRSVLMLIDLDHFKPVNDEGGHLVGDDLLKRLADLFKEAVRKSDIVARLGGDEFGIILPACGLERAEALAERIRARVQDLRIEQDGRSFGVTASIGLTELTPGDSGPREVVSRADEGSYIAKSRGRNAVVVVPAPSDDSGPARS
ncbi:diguanylate cyclase [Marinobacter sp. M216]|uniref:Diguanylate cyclase n=1 Tax=Marinobacter albus TaxID=3030833 RepID=A0ABT7HDR0_9GAMM|nr:MULTISPECIES: diguanylate cyclase [unclassified Marinobacter]MBW7471939.1 diguanylate cyclase [Marinobacter sp. F4218]MDK9558509.1 diguanylate cyclase [Marinobacter sp. M216]